MAREMGLSGLSNVMPKRGGKERESEPRSRQAIYFGRAEREIMRSGGYSWVGDIRARVALAKNTSRTEGEFRVALAKLGISVEEQKSQRPDKPLTSCFMVDRQGFEPWTLGLRVPCSAS